MSAEVIIKGESICPSSCDVHSKSDHQLIFCRTSVSDVAVRGPGDGMETYKPPVAPELSVEAPLLKLASPKRSPRAAAPGVLHLGKVSRDACTELEAVRIVVPRSAISRSARAAPHAEDRGSPQHGDERPPSPEPLDYRSALEKLQNSERRLLQDKEGLSNQLRVQTEVRPA